MGAGMLTFPISCLIKNRFFSHVYNGQKRILSVFFLTSRHCVWRWHYFRLKLIRIFFMQAKEDFEKKFSEVSRAKKLSLKLVIVVAIESQCPGWNHHTPTLKKLLKGLKDSSQIVSVSCWATSQSYKRAICSFTPYQIQSIPFQSGRLYSVWETIL